MNKAIALLMCLLASTALFAQEATITPKQYCEKDSTNFHPIFKAIDEMVGKNVRFATVDYKEQIDYVFVKRGKRLTAFKGAGLPFRRYETYLVEDIVTDKNGKRYAQLYDSKNNNRFYLYSPYSSYLCKMLFDYDEFKRFKDYTKKYWVYREIEHGEVTYNRRPYEYLPYVEVEESDVDVFKNNYGKGFTISFFYFTGNGDRFIDYDAVDFYSRRFLSEDELLNKEREYQEQQRIKIERLTENSKKYGVTIATALFKGGFWNEERVDELIDLVGQKEAEYIVSGEVHIGMTREMCVLSWGEPDVNNKTTYSFGVKEQWVYRAKDAYLYFDDGILTAISVKE